MNLLVICIYQSILQCLEKRQEGMGSKDGVRLLLSPQGRLGTGLGETQDKHVSQ